MFRWFANEGYSAGLYFTKVNATSPTPPIFPHFASQHRRNLRPCPAAPPRRHPSPTHRSLSTIRSSLSFVGYFVLLLWLQFSLIQKSRRLRLAFIRFFGVFSSPPPKLCMYRYIRLLSCSPHPALLTLSSIYPRPRLIVTFVKILLRLRRRYSELFVDALASSTKTDIIPCRQARQRGPQVSIHASLSLHPTITPFQHFIFVSYFCSSWF